MVKSSEAAALELPDLRVFVGDSSGRIHALYTQSKKYEPVNVHGSRYGPAVACQELVSAVLTDAAGNDVGVLAVARKDGTIDILRVPTTDTTVQSEPADLEAKLLCSLREGRMRVGVERWVGLKLTKDSGVLSCTSGGKFRYVPLSRYTLGDTSNEYKDLESLSEEQLDEIACKWTVPGPLHHVAFYPETSVTPRYFAYGGEQVPLSVWDLPKALEYYAHSSEESVPTSGDAITDDAQKTGEKRRASSGKSGKQRELLPGEVWRAKNLPNDALSLQRHPLIRSISFLTSGDDAAGEAMYERMVVLVGTKDGLVRVYEPSKKPRHTAEWQVVPKGQGSIRVMDVCPTEQAVFIGDTARNLYMVDSRSGRTLFQYKDITGTISSLLVLEVEGAPTRLLGSSLDHLVRLFDLGEPYGPSQRKRGKTLEQFFSGTDNPTAMTIDPLAVPRVEHRTTEDDEDVWANMAVVGKDEEAQAASAKRARHE